MGLDLLLGISAYLMDLIKNMIVIHIFFKYRFKNKLILRLVMVTIAAGITISLSILLNISEIVTMFLSILLLVASLMYIFKGNICKLGLFTFISYLMVCIIDMLDNLLVTSLPFIVLSSDTANETIMRLSDTISLILLLTILLLQKLRKRSYNLHINQIHWSYNFLIFWIIFCFALLIASLQIISFESKERISFFIVICLLIVTFGITFIIMQIIRATYVRDTYKARLRLNQQYLEAQQQYYSLLSEKNEDTRRFRHDIRNHLLCLQALAQENKIAEIKEYIQDLSINLQDISIGINSGSSIVDAIISDALRKNPGIIVKVKGALPSPLRISAVDLCTIFSNLILNAIEATLKLEDFDQKEIIIDIKNLDNYIYINAVNPVKEKVEINNNTVITTKEDKDMHGFGLRNIQNCVEKYSGFMELNSTEYEFNVGIVIKNVKNNRLA